MQNEGPNTFGFPFMTIEEKIRLFAELPGDERRDVVRYVEEHENEKPHLKALLEDARRLGQLLESARVLSADPPDEEAVAYYAVMRDVDRTRMPSGVAADLERLGRRIAADPDLQQLLRRYEERADELASTSDAESQFARLSGTAAHSESTRAAEEPVPGDAPPSKTRPDRSTRRRYANGESNDLRNAPTDREPIAPRSANRAAVLRRTAGVVLVVAIVYALLFAAGRWMQPEHERLARFSSDELQLAGYEDVRSHAGEDGDSPVNGALIDSPTTAYVQSLEYLREAETSFVGLFPRFREAPLDSAAALLRSVIDQEPDDSFLADEARYFLGKTELARGNISDARSALEQVAESPSVRADEARTLLERMEP